MLQCYAMFAVNSMTLLISLAAAPRQLLKGSPLDMATEQQLLQLTESRGRQVDRIAEVAEGFHDLKHVKTPVKTI